MRSFALFILATWLSNCAYKPEDAGLCKLNCSDAIIGGNDSSMVIDLKSKVNSISCPTAAANATVPDPLLVQFVIAEKFDEGGGKQGKRPVPSLSFEPIVNGLRSEEEIHNPNSPKVDGVFTPARYKGVVTPKTNWCTDSCGVATLEIFARCPDAGETSEIGVQVHTGALYSDEIAVFSVSTKDVN